TARTTRGSMRRSSRGRPPAGRPREERRIEPRVVRAVVAVAPGAFGMLDGNARRIEPEDELQVRLEVVDALGVAPDVDRPAGPLRDRARSADGCVRDVGLGEGSAARRAHSRGLWRSALQDEARLVPRGPQPFAEPRRVGKRLALVPAGVPAQALEGGARRLLAIGDDADEAA